MGSVVVLVSVVKVSFLVLFVSNFEAQSALK